MLRPVRTGRVSEFDDRSGLGRVVTRSGTTYLFQCTRIGGGSRTVPVGASVTFTLAPGHDGRWEAVDVTSQSP